MIIEIRKAGFVNKGAELMLHATLIYLRQRYPDAVFVMAPGYAGNNKPYYNYFNRTKIGLLQKIWLPVCGIQWGELLNIFPRKLLEMYGVILDKDIDIVIDIAGFAYGDQWGYGQTKELAQSCKRWKKRGTKIILLPQALGPFSSKKIKKLIKVVVDNADLVFSRDHMSFSYLLETVGERRYLDIAPDFTNLLDGVVPNYFTVKPNQYCIIPNCRMLDMTTCDTSSSYLQFMINCTKKLHERGMSPFLLVHEGEKDRNLAEKICGGVCEKLQVIVEDDPLKIKGIIGACDGSIGSRFHGLVSALSQGVPALGTGWSHKYQMLFEEYGFADGLLDITCTNSELEKKIELIVDPRIRVQTQKILLKKSKELREKSEEMWRKVFQVIDRDSTIV